MIVDGEKVTANVEDDDAFTADEKAYMDGRGEVEAPAEPATAAKPSEAKAPAAPPEADKAGEKEPEVEKLVKHGAFEEERQRRKKAEAHTRELEKRLAFLEGQQQGNAGDPPAKQPTLDEIDEEKNPVGAIAALKAEIRARKDSEATSQAVSGIISTGQQHCRQFAEKEPQFFNTTGSDGRVQEGAYAYLRRATAEKIKAEREANGQPTDPAAIEQLVNYHEIKLINDALEMRMNPAAAMWHWAQIAGFKPRMTEPTPPAPKTPAPPTEAEKIANLEKAQSGAKSLGSIPAGGGEATPTLKAIADMDDDEFTAATKGNNWEKLHRQGVI